ncbi:helix-turn-helix domain-containing protein [Eilatimonas milleporae]|uniref:Helix-turn-helix protein n=1 Tax=Eilatimonas milleporae TaxID=911205 RepID=A0A3M0C712_9PROT|nr:helix-turn-helix transcriptional regulator [Eilatimonas milleporae]RMB04695.1 helix-turn-helix protein [Eilatimonas milleporae]
MARADWANRMDGADWHPPAPNPVDRMIGQRLRTLRIACGLSQSALAGAAGVSFQQVQKYETGANKIAPSKLLRLALALGIQPADFFNGLDDGMNALETAAADPSGDCARLLYAFARIPEPHIRESFVAFVKAMAEREGV